MAEQRSEFVEMFVEFMIQTKDSPDGPLMQLRGILQQPASNEHFSVKISATEVSDRNHTLGNSLLQNPTELMPCLDEALISMQQRLSVDPRAPPGLSVKKNVHARLCWVPDLPEFNRSTVSSLRSSDVGRLVCVAGTVVRCGSVLMRESSREYECTRCGYKFPLRAPIDQKGVFPLPTRCPSSRDKPCPSGNFRVVDGSAKCTDYQEIKVQDQVQLLAVGCIPRNVLVVLENDIVDTIKAGDDVRIIGVLKRRWNRSLYPDSRPDIEMMLDASNINVENEDKSMLEVPPALREEFESLWESTQRSPLAVRDMIVRSICPQLFGMAPIKLALALTLVGGVTRTERGTRTRGECHLLLIGDPGIGKSQFLKFACRMSPRSVLTTGVGSTSAGLTVAAVKDAGGEWCLEAGALVLSDRGVCAIDELSSIRDQDRATIHEAMEQQTLSVAKAGMVCKLDTRTTVIAATNPKGKYNSSNSISLNTTIASPLLSRFDMIFVLKDNQVQEWDRAVSSHILRDSSGADSEHECAVSSAALTRPSTAGSDFETMGDSGLKTEEAATGSHGVFDLSHKAWSLEKLQMYFHHCKQNYKPQMGKEAGEVLQAYYQTQRRCGQRLESRTTIRMLESLVRLAQAHARLCMRNTVEVQDAIVVVNIMATSMDGVDGESEPWARDSSEDSVLRDFDSNPDDGYIKMKQRVLAGLGLKPSMIDARPTQRTYDRHVYMADADECGLSAGEDSAPPTLAHHYAPHSQPCGQGRAADVASVVSVAAVKSAPVGCSDEDDEVDGLRFDSYEVGSLSAGTGVDASNTNARGQTNATVARRASTAAAGALAECQPNAPTLQAPSHRLGKRKAEETVSRSLQAFRQLHSQQSALDMARDEIDDDEADALDML